MTDSSHKTPIKDFYLASARILRPTDARSTTRPPSYASDGMDDRDAVPMVQDRQLVYELAHPTLASSYSLEAAIRSARGGVLFEDFQRIYDMISLTTLKWSEIIGVSERTMQTILKTHKDLDQHKAEKLIAFLMMVTHAVDVFGDLDRFESWFHYEAPALGGQAPVDYVDTYQGVSWLREQLYRIEHGILA